MITKRKRHEAAFKARVALEALKGVKTIQQIASEYGVHPVQVSDWKKTLQERTTAPASSFSAESSTFSL